MVQSSFQNHKEVNVQTPLYYPVQLCAANPPALQLYSSVDSDAERVGILSGFLTSALQAMTVNTILWMQHPSDAVSGGSPATTPGLPTSSLHTSTHHGEEQPTFLLVVQTCPNCGFKCAAPVGYQSTCSRCVPVRLVVNCSKVEETQLNQIACELE